MMKINILISILTLVFASAGELDNNILYKAASDELDRSMHELKIDKQAKPYYISYRIEDSRRIEIKAEFGGLLYSDDQRSRKVYVDLRVGDYKFDNSNFVCQTKSSRITESDYTNLPLDDDYDAIRNALWLVTDGTYKKALEKLSRKKATVQNQPKKEDIPDFSKVSRCDKIESVVELNINKAEWENRVVQLSKVFQRYPKIQKSEVKFYALSSNQYFLDTEDNRNRRSDVLAFIEISAKTQSNDGDPIEDCIGFYCHTPDELPDINIMNTKVCAMAETLSLQTALEKEEDYSGPVLFVGQAAAEFFFQLLGKGVSAPKASLFENEMLASTLASKELGVLTRKFGRRAMSSFLSAYDDPNLTDWNGTPLIGHFTIDDQGVCAQKVDLVKEGKITSVLMSRTPTKKVKESNGHGRYRDEQYGARVCGMVGNLIITSSEQYTKDKLHNMLIDICKDYEIPYGIIITKLTTTAPQTLTDRYMRYFKAMTGGSEKPLLSSPVVAYKVYVENGEIELIRGLDFSSVTIRVLRDIVATGDIDIIYNFMYRDDEGNEYPMSVVVPPILVEEMDLVTEDTKPKKLPILSHPHF